MTSTTPANDPSPSGESMVGNIYDLMREHGLAAGTGEPIEKGITSLACSTHNTGTDLLNDDGSFDVAAFRAAEKERMIRAATHIKPGEHVSRLLQGSRSLDNYEISDSIKDNLQRMNVTALTPLQEDFVEAFVGDRTRLVHKDTKEEYKEGEDRDHFVSENLPHPILTDVICIAETGAGKTLSYGIPLVEYIRGRPMIRKMPLRREKAEPFVIVLAPTHELAIEIHATLLDLCYTEKIRCVLVYGGAPTKDQLKKLSGGCEILVATPGRLLDFMRQSTRVFGQRQFLSLDSLRFLVFDEADELLGSDESSFAREIDGIEQLIPTDRDEDLTVNHWFLSSQYSDEQLNRAEGLIGADASGSKDYHFIDFDMPYEDESQRYIKVEQEFICHDGIQGTTNARFQYLQETYFPQIDLGTGKCLILARTIDDVDNIEYFINAELKIQCEKLHGSMSQPHREQAMHSFKHGHVSVLVATMKLCGRGVNVDGIKYLMFWELPGTLEEYKFCLGRVGRLGNKATSTAFYPYPGGVMDRRMKSFLETNKQPIPKLLNDYLEFNDCPTDVVTNMWPAISTPVTAVRMGMGLL